MVEFTETTKHIKLNKYGTPVLAETNLNVVTRSRSVKLSRSGPGKCPAF